MFTYCCLVGSGFQTSCQCQVCCQVVAVLRHCLEVFGSGHLALLRVDPYLVAFHLSTYLVAYRPSAYWVAYRLSAYWVAFLLSEVLLTVLDDLLYLDHQVLDPACLPLLASLVHFPALRLQQCWQKYLDLFGVLSGSSSAWSTLPSKPFFSR